MSDHSITEAIPAEALVGQIADEFLERLQRGDEPHVEEYTSRYPEVGSILRQVLPALRVIRSPELEIEPGIGQLGDYRIVREVGRGGMGIVYEAEQVSLGRCVALKVLPFGAAVEPRLLQRFKQEAQAAAHLVHQNIVAVYAVGCERGVHYYAMQFIDGQSLAHMIAELRQNGETKPDIVPVRPDADTAVGCISTEASISNSAFFRSVCQLGIQAAEALEHAHQQGVLHRDVKPANLLVDGHGHLWVTDFGLARFHREANLTQTGDLVGTLRYISPEQALGPHALVDQRTDVYGLGASLYELLTLHPVHDGSDRNMLLRQIERDEPIAIARRNSTVPAELETVIHKALAAHPADRYTTAQELADDLRRVLEDKPIHAKRPTVLQRFAKWRRRHQSFVRAATAMLILGVVVLAIGTVVIWREKKQAQQAQARAETEKRRAEVRYRIARLAPDDIYTDAIENWLAETEVMRKWLTRQAAQNVERELLSKALSYYEEQAAAADRDPSMRVERAIIHRRIGEVMQRLQRARDAEAAYRQSIRLFENLSDDASDVPDFGWNLVVTLDMLAGLLVADTSRIQEAEEAYNQALAFSARLTERFPELPDPLATEAQVLSGLGELLRTARRFTEAEQQHARAIDLLRGLTSRFPSTPAFHSRLARSLHTLARVFIDQKKLHEAAASLHEAVRHQRIALTFNTKYPNYRQGIIEHFRELFPVLFQLGKYQEAAESAELLAGLLPERSCDMSAAVQVLNVCVVMVDWEAQRPDAERNAIKQQYIDRARELHREAVRRSAGDPDLQDLLAWQLATAKQEWIRDPEQGVALAQKAVAQRPMEPGFWTTLGLARYRAGDTSGSVAALMEAIRIGNGGSTRDWLYLALAHKRRGSHDEARKWYDRASAELPRGSDDNEIKSLRVEAGLCMSPPRIVP